uniref:Uncharacterized protein n=1 Tax=Arundo donax TaxID=35708 RepID=A0A0A9EG95_ARUDO
MVMLNYLNPFCKILLIALVF